MKVVVDIFGGDNAPQSIIEGCVLALNKYKGFDIVMVGKKDIIEKELFKYKFDLSRIEILNADDIITNDDVPTVAIRSKKESSLVVALDRLKTDSNCVGLVSAGSTGAVLTGAFLKLGRISGISRPALAPLLPTTTGQQVLLIDCGANVDCKASMLADFALMGNAYMKEVLNIEKPRVALLSNGVEDKKGNELVHEAFALLKELPINFIGNIEARDITMCVADVIVTDGFAGNVALKASEGAANFVLKSLKKELMSSFKGKLGALILKKSFKNLKSTLDFNEKGGAPFLGVEKLVIKSHGSSKAFSICGSIMQVVEMSNYGLIEKIKEALSKNSEKANDSIN